MREIRKLCEACNQSITWKYPTTNSIGYFADEDGERHLCPAYSILRTKELQNNNSSIEKSLNHISSQLRELILKIDHVLEVDRDFRK
jgi:hypothetical protein